ECRARRKAADRSRRPEPRPTCDRFWIYRERTHAENQLSMLLLGATRKRHRVLSMKLGVGCSSVPAGRLWVPESGRTSESSLVASRCQGQRGHDPALTDSTNSRSGMSRGSESGSAGLRPKCHPEL